MVKQEIMMLHSFIKKTQKTPEKELKIAKARMKDNAEENKNAYS